MTALNIACDAAIDQAADRIAHCTVVQRTLIDNDQVGLGARAQAAEVMTAKRHSATKRRRMKSLASSASVGRLGSDFAEQAGVAHLADKIKGMNVRAQPDIDATCQIAGEVMQVHAAPRQRHRAVGYIGVRCCNALEDHAHPGSGPAGGH